MTTTAAAAARFKGRVLVVVVVLLVGERARELGQRHDEMIMKGTTPIALQFDVFY